MCVCVCVCVITKILKVILVMYDTQYALDIPNPPEVTNIQVKSAWCLLSCDIKLLVVPNPDRTCISLVLSSFFALRKIFVFSC